jgi:Cu(I)/Ag(I) efflux system membrane fusion protein
MPVTSLVYDKTHQTVSTGDVKAVSGNAAGAASAANKKPLYWHDPMVPGQKFDKPGKSPFMDMPLVPVYAAGMVRTVMLRLARGSSKT